MISTHVREFINEIARPCTIGIPGAVAALLNGLKAPDSYIGGPLYVEDYQGTLVTSGADKIAVPGMRWTGTEWVNDDGAGNDLYTSQLIRTRNGVVRQYNDPTWQGMMIAPARTNLLTYSEQFDNAAWSKTSGGNGTDPVVTENAGTAPNGTITAYRVQLALNGGTTTSDQSQLQQLPQWLTTGVAYIQSVWLKSYDGTSEYQVLVDFNGQTPALVTVTGLWTRFDALLSSLDTTARPIQPVRLRGDQGTSDSADILIWGTKLEQGSFPTPYIPTTDTTVTRPASVASFTSPGRIREQNCCVWGRVVPGAGGQGGSSTLLASAIDVNNETILREFSAGTLQYFKRIAGSATVVNVSYSTVANTPFEYRALWTDQGMAIQVKEDDDVWSAWYTDPNTDPAPIADTFEVGSRNGASQFAGTYPWTATAFMPAQKTLADYQNWIETNTEWNKVGA